MEYFRYFLDKVAASQPTHVCKSRGKKNLTTWMCVFNVHGILRTLNSSYCSLLSCCVCSSILTLRLANITPVEKCNERNVCFIFFFFLLYSFRSIDDRLFLSNQVGVTSQYTDFNRSFAWNVFFCSQFNVAVPCTPILTSMLIIKSDRTWFWNILFIWSTHNTPRTTFFNI